MSVSAETQESQPIRALGIAIQSLEAARTMLEEEGILLSIAPDFEEAAQRLQDSMDWDVVLVPIAQTEYGQFCEDIAQNHPAVEIVLVAPTAEAEAVNQLMDEIDIDYLDTKSPDLIVARIRRAARARHRRLEILMLRKKISHQRGYDAILGISQQMQDVFELIERAATSKTSVLITGESGTGKELIARALHRNGPRADRPFVAINCSAVPDALLESELFGHVRGAFTDAKETRAGLFQKAQGGTIFLDEIGDMPLTVQPKLLRVLQERRVRPVGGDAEVPIDVRVVAATHADLEDSVAKRTFRQDLFYRLNVIHIEVPPLRDRAGDIVLLAEAFVQQAAQEAGKDIVGISRPATGALLKFGWPGNVRELQNYIERAVTLCDDEVIRVIDLPQKLRPLAPERAHTAPPSEPEELVPLEVVERRYIEHVLHALGGNKKAAARTLGLDRKTLYRKLDRYRIPEDGDPDALGS